jgi:hypothetical protein
LESAAGMAAFSSAKNMMVIIFIAAHDGVVQHKE